MISPWLEFVVSKVMIIQETCVKMVSEGEIDCSQTLKIVLFGPYLVSSNIFLVNLYVLS